MWLDFKIFGNGRGLGAPYFPQAFYWCEGRFYTWIGGFGAQLGNFQWTHPKPGERRKLFGREFVAFNSHRRWLRVSASWAMVDLPKGIDEANAAIRQLKNDLHQ